jgi:hypothetical protein
MSDGGKGSDRRPGQGYQDGWDRIFGNKNKQPEQPKEQEKKQ